MGLCAVSRWCEGCRNKGKAQSSSALDRISERIALAFQTLAPPRSNPAVNHRKHGFSLYFNRIWRGECQSIPIDAKAIFHFGTWEPTVLATSHWPIPSVRCAPTLCVICVELDAATERAISACGGDARKTAKGLIVANDFLGLRRNWGRVYRKAILAVGFRRSASSRMPARKGAALSFCSSELAHS
jgi:hypothetical protein